MRGKTAIMVLAAAALLVLLIVLKQSIGSASDTRHAGAPVEPAATPAVESARLTSAARDPKIPLPALGAPARTPPVSPTESPAEATGIGIVTTASPDAKKRPPIANKPMLRDQNIAVEALVAECVAKATGKTDGTANLTFIVAPKGKDAVVETTDVDRDTTTIDNEPLVECLHKTALQMKFSYVADSDAVVARRKITIEQGKVTENTLVSFSYLR